MSLLRRLFLLARPYWIHIPGVFALDLLSTPLALLAPVPLAIAVDSVIGSKPLPGPLAAILPDAVAESSVALLAVVAGLLALIAFLTQLQSVGSTWLTTYVGERMQLDLRSRLFDRAQRVSLSYHDTKGTADSTYRIQYDTAAVQSVAVGSVTSVVTAATTLGGMLLVTFRLDWQLGLVAITVTPLLFFISQTYRRRLRNRYREVKDLESSALSIVQEVLGVVRVVKAFGQEDREQERFVRRSHEGMRARLRLILIEGGLGMILALITGLGTGAVLYLGVRHVQTGVLTLGQLVLIMTYLTQLYAPLKTLSSKLAKLQGALVSADRAFELLDHPPEVEEHPHARHIERARGDIEFRGVSFSYDGRNRAVEDLTFDIPAGTRVGIAGRTGAGKTTVTNLLMRLYDPDEGVILLDGVDLREYRLEEVRGQFAVVLQEPVLFSTTVTENIAYARPDAHFDEIVAAAKAANAHDFVVALPEGYDTRVGERGMRLSGGERQRVSLARAFLKDAPILVLDEPTSSVDINTENSIMEAMDRLMSGRTTFMIAHRLSTLEGCDARLQMEGGRVVDASRVESGDGAEVGHAAGEVLDEHSTGKV